MVEGTQEKFVESFCSIKGDSSRKKRKKKENYTGKKKPELSYYFCILEERQRIGELGVYVSQQEHSELS